MAAETNKPNFQYVWASGGSKVAPSDVKIQNGWTAEVPPFQWENWSQNRQDEAILHLFQKGISEWDALSNYYFTASGVRSYVQGSNGTIYVAVQDSIGQNPVTDSTNTYWQKAFTGGTLLATRVITVSGTYTPTPGMKLVRIRYCGGGGGSGGTSGTTSAQVSMSSGGASGSWGEAWLTAAQIGVSQSVVIGLGGTAGVVAGTGGAGGTTSLGLLLTAPGGGCSSSGLVAPTGGSSIAAGGIPGGQSSGGNVFNSNGSQGGFGISTLSSVLAGLGGSSPFGGGGQQSGVAIPGTGYGSGASGVANGVSAGGKAGAAGAPGVMIIEEYA